MLTINDHRRDRAGLTYIYPVVSRRAGGVSIGVNLNPNNACNWACVYCQVPDLVRGGPPPIALELLESELRDFVVDVAFSGNGEPTSAVEFAAAVLRVERVLREFSLIDTVKIRLITNGSLMHREGVCQGVARIGALGGEVWFKLDRATVTGVERVNQVPFSLERTRNALLRCAGLAETWIQTCWFALDGAEADESEQRAYLDLIESVREKIKGVHLYGLARPSLQPGAARLSALPPEVFQRFAGRIAALGVGVVANP